MENGRWKMEDGKGKMGNVKYNLMTKIFNLYPFSLMPFGVHKGKLIIDLIANHRDYVIWCIRNIDAFSISLLHFEYIFKNISSSNKYHINSYDLGKNLNIDEHSINILKSKNDILNQITANSNINIGTVVKLKNGLKKYLIKEKKYILNNECYFDLIGINTFSNEDNVPESKLEISILSQEEKQVNTDYYNRITFQNSKGFARKTYGLFEIKFYLCYICGYRETINSQPYYEAGKIKFPIIDKNHFIIKNKEIALQHIMGFNPEFVYKLYEYAVENLSKITKSFDTGYYLESFEEVFRGICPKCGCKLSSKKYIDLNILDF